MAKKAINYGKIDIRQQESFKKLKNTGLAPEFTLRIGDIYFESQVRGPTVYKVGCKRKLISREIREIASTWVKIGRYLSKSEDYSLSLFDTNAGNIMFRESEDIPEFVVVDIYKKRSENQANPMIFIRNLMRFYVTGKGCFAVKSAIDNDIMPIFSGIHEGLGNDEKKTREFFREALKFRAKDEQSKFIQEEIKKFLAESFIGIDNQRANLQSLWESINTRVCM